MSRNDLWSLDIIAPVVYNIIDKQYKAYDQDFDEKADIKKKFNQIKNKIEELIPNLKNI